MTMMNDFWILYKDKVKAIDEYIENYFNNLKDVDETLVEAMKYSVLNGGKRLRSILLIECCKMFDKDADGAFDFAMAMEFMHACSLVHDDLPAMDNADYRRGQLSCHKKYGEAMAVLVGDSLLNLTYEVMADACGKNKNAIAAMSYIANAAGIHGMINGQVNDLKLSASADATKEDLIKLIEQKTIRLINASAVAGALLGGADKNQIDAIDKYSYNFGMAFQLRDDIEDEVEDAAENNNCPNFLNVFGKDKTVEMLSFYRNESEKNLTSVSNDDFLIMLNKYLYGE